MTILRQLKLQKLARPVVCQQPSVSFSAVSGFVKNVKSAAESNPELKKSVDQLRRSFENLLPRTISTAEELKRASDEASDQATQQVKGASAAFTRTTPEAQEGSQASSEEPASERVHSSQQASASAGPSASSGGSAHKEQASSSSTSKPRRPGLGARLSQAFAIVRKEVEDAVLPRKETTSATRARDPGVRPAGNPGSSAVSVVKQQQSRWQKQWAEMQDKLGLHPIFQRLNRLSDNKVFNKGREVAGDLRERWETSDSPLVQRIQDMRDSMFTETEQAQALREIRARVPDFDMVRFVRVLKGDVPVVIKAYLEGDLALLAEHCAPEMMERFSGIIAAQKAEGLTTDSTILDVSDVELVDLKFVDNNPVVVVQFTCQQINCARDRFGNTVEGGPQDVQRVYYYWALQQDDAGFVGEDGKVHPPRWQLREMMVRGMHNLL